MEIHFNELSLAQDDASASVNVMNIKTSSGLLNARSGVDGQDYDENAELQIYEDEFDYEDGGAIEQNKLNSMHSQDEDYHNPELAMQSRISSSNFIFNSPVDEHFLNKNLYLFPMRTELISETSTFARIGISKSSPLLLERHKALFSQPLLFHFKIIDVGVLYRFSAAEAFSLGEIKNSKNFTSKLASNSSLAEFSESSINNGNGFQEINGRYHKLHELLRVQKQEQASENGLMMSKYLQNLASITGKGDNTGSSRIDDDDGGDDDDHCKIEGRESEGEAIETTAGIFLQACPHAACKGQFYN